MTNEEHDRPLHALNQAYGRGFLAAFGYQPEGSEYGPKTRPAAYAAISEFRIGREAGRICKALEDDAPRRGCWA